MAKVLRKPHSNRNSASSELAVPVTSKSPASSYIGAAIGIALVVAIFAVYAQVSHFEFINYDDQQIVFQNEHTKSGINPSSLKWAFTSVVVGNWMPVTLISHMLDCQLFGLESGMHHLVNVLLHIIASLLLFLAFDRATHARWPSAFVAFAFALHPLHVESVAWVAERKDVLSACFWFLALYAYVRYTEAPDWRRYLMIVAPFALGLMSKAMLVTFPFSLFLIDFWPLRRPFNARNVWEKLPLIALSAAGSVATMLAQGSAKAFSEEPFPLRVANALTSVITYIGQMFWPSRLAMFYMYPDSVPVWKVVSAIVVIVGVTAAAIYTWRTRPYFVTGWLWFLGTLVPVIGLVQVGAQAHADRYMYIPMVGLLWILGWGAADVVAHWPNAKPAVVSVIAVACAICMVLTYKQVGYWQNGIELFQHAADVTENNFWVKYNLSREHYSIGNNLMNSGHGSEAIGHFEEALRLTPNYAEAENNLGILLAKTPGRSGEAMAHFEAALRLDPNLAQAHRNLAMLLAAIPGRLPEAIAHLESAQRIQADPDLPQLIANLRALEAKNPR